MSWIKENVDMLEVARNLFPQSEIILINPSKGEYGIPCANCRLCSEKPKKTKKLQINTVHCTYKCYRGCVDGGVVDLVMEVNGYDKKSAIAVLKEWFNITSDSKEKTKPFHPALQLPPSILKDMGFVVNSRLDWATKIKNNPERAKSELDWIWTEYEKYQLRQQKLNEAVDRLSKLLIERGSFDGSECKSYQDAVELS